MAQTVDPGSEAVTLPAGRAMIRLPAVVGTLVVVAVLAGLNVAEHLVSPGLWLGPAAAAALLWFARRSGLSWAPLGLGRDPLLHGGLWGAGAIAVICAVY